ncbi:MAG: pitrilysin family protein [Acidobacteriota bacterium]
MTRRGLGQRGRGLRRFRTLAPLAVPRLPGTAEVSRLANGLTVCVLHHPQAPVVTSALWYGVGTRDERPDERGIAHFLEHMMFKGSTHYPTGEIDHRTQALGGSNNAFTSHDATAYYFSFASDRWQEALRIESDRLIGLTLDPQQVESERQVIVEEIAMYQDDPWDALEVEVHAGLYGEHPYGKPVLGTAESLAAIGVPELRSFHHRHYRPDNAVLVVAGDLGDTATVRREIEATFGSAVAGGETRSPVPSVHVPPGVRRLERRHGEVPRLLLAMPGTAAADEDHPALRLLVTLLAGGRASRLQRALVDDGQLCLSATADLQDTVGTGCLTCGLEVLPGIEPAVAEAALLAELARARHELFDAEEIERARRITLADWVFGHERVHSVALTAGFCLSQFDLEHTERQLQAIVECDADRLRTVAARYLDPERGALLGWSMPEAGQ